MPLTRRPGTDTDLVRDSDGTLRWETRQDIRGIIERNKQHANETRSRTTNTQHHMRRVAEIPITMHAELMRTLGDPRSGDPEVTLRWKRWLNDPDFRAFRTDVRPV